MIEKEVQEMPYKELAGLERMIKRELDKRYEAEHAKAWNAVVEAIANYITNYDSITVMLPDDLSEVEADTENLDLNSTGIIVVN